MQAAAAVFARCYRAPSEAFLHKRYVIPLNARSAVQPKVVTHHVCFRNYDKCNRLNDIVTPKFVHWGTVKRTRKFFGNVYGFLPDSPSSSFEGATSSSLKPSWMLNVHALYSSSSTSDTTPTKLVTNQNQGPPVSEGKQMAEMKILHTLTKYLWMKDNLEFRVRVIAALGFLIGAKVLNVQVPFLFKLVVDWLTTATGNAGSLAKFTIDNSTILALFASPAAALVGYGIARSGASAFNELRTAVFSKVALRTIRSVSRKVTRTLEGLARRGDA